MGRLGHWVGRHKRNLLETEGNALPLDESASWQEAQNDLWARDRSPRLAAERSRPTLFPWLERGLQSRPPTTRTFQTGEPHFGARGSRRQRVLGFRGCDAPVGYQRFSSRFWGRLLAQPCVRGHSVVRDFVSQFLAAAGCRSGRPSLAGLAARRTRPDGRRWTSSDAMVPNGLTLDVDLRKKRRGRVPSGLPTVHFGGALSSRTPPLRRSRRCSA